MVNRQEEVLLIEKAKQGQQVAFSQLLSLHWKSIAYFFKSKSLNEDEAEDFTIKTFSKAFDKISTYSTEFSFSTWVTTIAKNIYIDHLRKKKTEFVSYDESESEFLAMIDDSPSPEDTLIIEQNLAQLLGYIKLLKPHYKEIIQLRYFQELSYQEISDHLGEPMNNVKIKILRAKKLLAGIIQKNG